MYVLTITFVGILALTAFGCAHTGHGPSDSELIAETLGTWIEASKAKDVEKIMSAISEDFKHDGYDYSAEDKGSMRVFIEDSVAMGNFDGLEISYDPEAVTIDGDTAQVPDIEWSCTPGMASVELTLKKEDGVWRIVDAEVVEF
jgi:hypothetical protein